MTPGPVWVDVIVAALLVASGLLVVISAVGFLRLREFFLRMHPPALATSSAATITSTHTGPGVIRSPPRAG